MNKNELKSTFWLLSAMVLLLIIAIATGCRSQRASQTIYAENSDTKTIVRADSSSTQSTLFSWSGKRIESVDSILVSFTADSIVAPSGAIVYSPIMQSQCWGQDRIESVQCESSGRSTTATAHQDSISALTRASASLKVDREITAIAKPPDLIAIAVIAAMLLLGGCLIKSK